MGDLVLNINYKESKQLKKLVIETYSGKIKILKNKTFSGPLTKIDIENESFNNLSSEELEDLKKLILNPINRKVSKFKYLIEGNSFADIFEFCCKKHNLYFTSKDGRMNVIDSVVYINEINYKINSNKKITFFYKENETEEELSNKANITIFNDKSLIYEKNKLLILEKLINLSFIEDMTEKNFMLSNMITSNIEKKLYINKKNEIISKNEYKQEVFYDIKPTPVLYISFDKAILLGELYFKYSEIEVPGNSTEEYLYLGNKKYCRDKKKENYFINILLDINWNKSTGNLFKFKYIDKIHVNINELIAKEFTIFTEKNKRVLPSKNVNVNISYNVNWFELEGSITINDKIYSLSQLIDLKDKRNNFVELDDSVAILPEFIIEQKKNYNKKEKKIILKNNQIGEVFELENRLNINKEKRINKFFDWNEIELRLPINLKNILREYQHQGVKWLKYMYKSSIGGCLADDMGLGKTLQAISFLSDKDYKSNEKITLIIVPKTLLSNWEREISKFNPELKVKIYHGVNRKRIFGEINKSKGIYLTTYNTVLNDIKCLLNIKFDCLILDEVQYIKNSKSKTYSAINKLNTENRFALSGTPFENNVSEVWALMNLLNNSVWGSKNNFIKEYGDITADDKIKIKRLKTRISPYVLRRNKKEVLKNLPQKLEQNIYCDMTEEQRTLYESWLYKIKEEIKRQPERFEIKSNSIVLEGLMTLRQICDHPNLLPRNNNIIKCHESGKFELFKMKIEEIVTNNNKVIVFSQFTSMLKIIENWIKKQGYRYYYLDGKTKDRQSVVDEFEKSDAGIFLISLKAGGTGLNLISCKYEIIYDPWWNPSVENQAEDRIYRIGQTKDVIIYRFITTNSIEEKIQELKSKKSEIGESLFSDMDSVKTLSFTDIKNLLELSD